MNAIRCGRLHCYLTAPFFLGGAILTVLNGLGWVSIPWHWLGLAIIGGGGLLISLPERLWGRYTRC